MDGATLPNLHKKLTLRHHITSVSSKAPLNQNHPVSVIAILVSEDCMFTLKVLVECKVI